MSMVFQLLMLAVQHINDMSIYLGERIESASICRFLSLQIWMLEALSIMKILITKGEKKSFELQKKPKTNLMVITTMYNGKICQCFL